MRAKRIPDRKRITYLIFKILLKLIPKYVKYAHYFYHEINLMTGTAFLIQIFQCPLFRNAKSSDRFQWNIFCSISRFLLILLANSKSTFTCISTSKQWKHLQRQLMQFRKTFVRNKLPEILRNLKIFSLLVWIFSFEGPKAPQSLQNSKSCWKVQVLFLEN